MITQRSNEWREARRGYVTASQFKHVLRQPQTKRAREAGEWSESAKSLMDRLVAERISQQHYDTWCSDDMKRGIEQEPSAFEESRVVLAETMGVTLCEPVDEWAFFEHPTEDWIGASPDGVTAGQSFVALLGDKGVSELKCPRLPRHLKAMRTNNLDDEHEDQIEGQLWVTGREWLCFASYNREMKNIGQSPLWYKIVHVDPAWRENCVPRILEFRDAVDKYEESITGVKVPV